MAITITISLSGRPITELTGIQHSAGMTVRQAMEAAWNSRQDAEYNFAMEYYGQPPAGFGYEVIMIDNLTMQVGSEQDTFVFWQLSVNGQLSSDGIDGTALDDGDSIEWDYTSYVPDVHGGTHYEALRDHARRPR